MTASFNHLELPSIIAIPVQEWLHEEHKVIKLYRMCDVAEVLTRFLTITAFGELRGTTSPPKPLGKKRKDLLSKPTFGKWKQLLKDVSEELGEERQWVFPELRGFVEEHLLPIMPGTADSLHEECIITLRNLLAHGGAMTHEMAQHYLEIWIPKFESRLLPKMDFFRTSMLCQVREGVLKPITGEGVLSDSFNFGDGGIDLGLFEGHIVLIRGDSLIDLWPLCDFGFARIRTLSGEFHGNQESPMIYIRAEGNRLDYAALIGTPPLNEQVEEHVLKGFRDLFQPEESDKELSDRSNEEPRYLSFCEEIKNDAQQLYGRDDEIEVIKQAVAETSGGVLWVDGRAGIGKSTLLSRIALELSEPDVTDRQRLVIAWRFEQGDVRRCNRVSFLRYAVASLSRWLNRKAKIEPSADPCELESQLLELFRNNGLRPRHRKDSRPQRQVLFILDGVDEIATSDPSFTDLPFIPNQANIVWLCAGRPEPELERVFCADRCTHVFPNGLPGMSERDIRAMLYEGLLNHRDKMVLSDTEYQARDGSLCVQNRVLDAIAERSEGLPLYIRYVISDVLSGHFDFHQLEHCLPKGLNNYYDDLLKRFGLGDLPAIVTPLLTAIVWSPAALDEETLFLLMARERRCTNDENGQRLVRKGLQTLKSLVKTTVFSEQDKCGFTPYHTSFSEHVRKNVSGTLAQQNKLAREGLSALVMDWQSIEEGHPAKSYAIQVGPQLLVEMGKTNQCQTLLTDIHFLEAKAESAGVFELVTDFDRLLRVMTSDSEDQYILMQLRRALREHIHFIGDHQESLFQCLWNCGWWYDSPEAKKFYPHVDDTDDVAYPWNRPGKKLFELLEKWRKEKELQSPGFRWLRTVRPPSTSLGYFNLLIGHEAFISAIAVSDDTACAVSASGDKTLRLWNLRNGKSISFAILHERIDDLRFASNNERIFGCGAKGTLFIWNARDLAQWQTKNAHEGGVTAIAVSDDGKRLFSGGNDGAIRVWNTTTLQCEETLLIATENAAIEGVESLAVCSDEGQVYFTVGATLFQWNWREGRLRTLLKFPGVVSSVAVSPPGTHILISVVDPDADPEFGQVLAYVYSTDNLLHLADIDDAGNDYLDELGSNALACFDPLVSSLASPRIAFSADGTRAAIAGRTNGFTLWSHTNDLENHSTDSGEVHSIAFFGNDCVLCGTFEGSIEIFNIVDVGNWRSDLRVLNWLDADNLIWAMSHDGSYVAMTWRGHEMELWDCRTGQLIRIVAILKRSDMSNVTAIAISGDDRTVACGLRDGGLWIYDCIAEKTEPRLIYPACAMEAQPRSSADPASANPFNKNIVNRTTKGQSEVAWDRLQSLVVSQSGDFIAFGTESGRIGLWDGRPHTRWIVDAHTQSVTTLTFSSDESLVASAGQDQLLRIWKTDDGSMIDSIETGDETVEFLRFSADDSCVACGMDTNVLRWFHFKHKRFVDALRPTGFSDFACLADEYAFQGSLYKQNLRIQAVDETEACAWAPTRGPICHLKAHPSGRSWVVVDQYIQFYVLEGH